MKTLYTFRCVFDRCPHRVNVCHDGKREIWYVRPPEELRGHEGHKMHAVEPYCNEDGYDVNFEGMSNEEMVNSELRQEDMISRARARASIDAGVAASYLPQLDTFDSLELLEAYIDIFSASYKRQGNPSPFKWKRTSTHRYPPLGLTVEAEESEEPVPKRRRSNRDSNGNRTGKPSTPVKAKKMAPAKRMSSIHYSCRKKSVDGVPCPLAIIAGETPCGKWELRFTRTMDDHNH